MLGMLLTIDTFVFYNFVTSPTCVCARAHVHVCMCAVCMSIEPRDEPQLSFLRSGPFQVSVGLGSLVRLNLLVTGHKEHLALPPQLWGCTCVLPHKVHHHTQLLHEAGTGLASLAVPRPLAFSFIYTVIWGNEETIFLLTSCS